MRIRSARIRIAWDYNAIVKRESHFMKSIFFAGVIAASLAVLSPVQPSRADAAAPTTCKDGTTSSSTGKGTCSGHGGVQKVVKGSVCKDGTTSTSTGKGTCSSHGGVQKPAASAP